MRFGRRCGNGSTGCRHGADGSDLMKTEIKPRVPQIRCYKCGSPDIRSAVPPLLAPRMREARRTNAALGCEVAGAGRAPARVLGPTPPITARSVATPSPAISWHWAWAVLG